MKYTTILIISTLSFSQELQVDGDLKVTGSIDAQGNPITNVGPPQAVTDALNLQTLNNMITNDGTYEFKFISVMFGNVANSNSGSGDYFIIHYKPIGSNWITGGFTEYLDQLSLEGWQISSRMISPFAPGTNVANSMCVVYELRRPLEE